MRISIRAEREIVAQLKYNFTRRPLLPGDNHKQVSRYLDSKDVPAEDRPGLLSWAEAETEDIDNNACHGGTDDEDDKDEL